MSLIGSISLKGAAIDDLTFKEYNVILNGNEKVNLLAPRNSKEGYLIESGFITTDKNVKIPNSNSIWSISGNKKLTAQSIKWHVSHLDCHKQYFVQSKKNRNLN